MQQDEGNWPSSVESGSGRQLVQFCHGAPGFVFSLTALRPHFPDLRNRFDDAIERARECIEDWELLKKKPSLCHGIFGNALALTPGLERGRFLAVAEPLNVVRMHDSDPTVFKPANYSRPYSTTTSYTPSSVWAWLVWQEDELKMLVYTDV